MVTGQAGRLVLVLGLPLLSIGVGAWVYRDATSRGRGELAPWLGLVVGGLLLAGTAPGLVALAVSADPAAQGFPTAIRVVPGLIALAVYLHFR